MPGNQSQLGSGRKFGPPSRSKATASEELKVALDNRAFEIQLFWQRSNYFLVLMSALGIGAFTVKDAVFSPIIATFAAACSFLWFRTNIGSKFWQESWEFEVVELSRELGIRSFEKPTSVVVKQVESALRNSHAEEGKDAFRRWIDDLIVSKPSVTYHMIVLSLASTCVWLLVAAIFTVRLFQSELFGLGMKVLQSTLAGHH